MCPCMFCHACVYIHFSVGKHFNALVTLKQTADTKLPLVMANNYMLNLKKSITLLHSKAK